MTTVTATSSSTCSNSSSSDDGGSGSKQATQLSQRDHAAWWGLEATYTVHLRVIGKPTVTTELCSLGVTVEALRANIDCTWPFLKGVGHFGPKFQVERDVPHQLFVHVR